MEDRRGSHWLLYAVGRMCESTRRLGLSSGYESCERRAEIVVRKKIPQGGR